MSTTTLKRLDYMELHYDPDNVRTTPADDGIIDLARSIDGVGLLEPLVVRKNGEGYVVIAGHRRLTAIGHLRQIGKWPEDQPIDCIVRTGITDETATAMQLVENLHRRDLTPLEEYQGYLRLTNEHGWKVKQIAEATGMTQPVIKARLAWAVLPADRLPELLESLGVGNTTELAKLPAAQRATLLAKKSIRPYDIDDIMRAAAAEARSVKVIAEIERRGYHLLVRNGEMHTDIKDDALPPELVELRNQMKADAETQGRRYFRDYLGWISTDSDVAEIIAKFDSFPAGTVIETSEKRRSFYVWAIIDKVNVGPSTFNKTVEEMSDYERDVVAAREAYDAQRNEWLEARKAAYNTWLETTAPGKMLAAAVYHTLCEWGVDDAEAREYKLVPDDDETTTVWEFAKKNATNLARAFAATAITVDDVEAFGFTDEHPQQQHVSNTHYDNEGRYVGPPTEDPEPDESIDD